MNWFVCKNKYGVHYACKSKCDSLQEFWDLSPYTQNAVYGPTNKKDAIQYVNDMNTEDLNYSKPTNSIISSFDDDFDDDDYSGRIFTRDE